MDRQAVGSVALTVAAADWRTVVDDLEERCDRIVRETLAHGTALAWLRQGEVSLLLSDDEGIRDLNRRYRQRDRPTNVLSFPNLDLKRGDALSPRPPGPVLLGDVAMSLERLREEASEQGKPMLDHFAHLLVHGALHLLGYDHVDDDEADVMEEMEATVLSSLGMAPPYEADDGAAPLGAQPLGAPS
jgi:probable rRNA maturation factor